jgi:hypothetical protein
MRRRPVLTLVLFALAVLVALPVQAKGSKAVGPFPVREPDEDSPLYVMYEALKAGVETDEAAGLKTYKTLVLPNRKSSKEASDGLLRTEWENLRMQGGSYLSHDLHGFKVTVEEMNPGPAYVNRKTQKVYITLRNKLEGEERRGLFIVERNAKGKWQLRSLNL